MSRPGGDVSDEALAAAANSGDRGALETLLARHLDRVHAICRRVTGHPEDALDATQEALIAVTRGLHRYDGRALFTTWLYRVSTNAALDELRRRKRRPEPAELSDDRPPAASGAGGAAAVGSSPVESAVAARLDVDAALAGLSPEFRAAVVLRDLCDLDYAEIAEILDVPIGTVRSRIARGRAAIANQLREPAAPPERPIG
ncbi:MAG TPA: sigma-70 family RNA polymerase sigma factor [Acidimicrobiia bacterium]|nr:sigma-70 family RNA polymerase sigma factor [Acidimicrobiia bacterium]